MSYWQRTGNTYLDSGRVLPTGRAAQVRGILTASMQTPTDYHVHLSPDLSLTDAVKLADSRSARFGIVEHPGAHAGIQTDAELESYARSIRAAGFLVGLQPVARGWAESFSQTARESLDYVLMDADTVPWTDGSPLLIWRHDNFIWNLDEFMTRYWDHIVGILAEEPIDIFARPTYLPVSLARHYEELWTKEHFDTIIEIAVGRNIALEIAEQVRVPSVEFVRRAKDAGATFTFGTNARDEHAGDFHYCHEIAEAVGLGEDDMLRVP